MTTPRLPAVGTPTRSSQRWLLRHGAVSASSPGCLQKRRTSDGAGGTCRRVAPVPRAPGASRRDTPAPPEETDQRWSGKDLPTSRSRATSPWCLQRRSGAAPCRRDKDEQEQDCKDSEGAGRTRRRVVPVPRAPGGARTSAPRAAPTRARGTLPSHPDHGLMADPQTGPCRPRKQRGGIIPLV